MFTSPRCSLLAFVVSLIGLTTPMASHSQPAATAGPPRGSATIYEIVAERVLTDRTLDDVWRLAAAADEHIAAMSVDTATPKIEEVVQTWGTVLPRSRELTAQELIEAISDHLKDIDKADTEAAQTAALVGRKLLAGLLAAPSGERSDRELVPGTSGPRVPSPPEVSLGAMVASLPLPSDTARQLTHMLETLRPSPNSGAPVLESVLLDKFGIDTKSDPIEVIESSLRAQISQNQALRPLVERLESVRSTATTAAEASRLLDEARNLKWTGDAQVTAANMRLIGKAAELLLPQQPEVGRALRATATGMSDLKFIFDSLRAGGPSVGAATQMATGLATVSVAMNLYAALSANGGGSSGDDALRSQLESLSNQIATFREEMRKTLQRLDDKMTLLLDVTSAGFRSVSAQLQNLQVAVRDANANLLEVHRRLLRIDESIDRLGARLTLRIAQTTFAKCDADFRLAAEHLSREVVRDCLQAFYYLALDQADPKEVTISPLVNGSIDVLDVESRLEASPLNARSLWALWRTARDAQLAAASRSASRRGASPREVARRNPATNNSVAQDPLPPPPLVRDFSQWLWAVEQFTALAARYPAVLADMPNRDRIISGLAGPVHELRRFRSALRSDTRIPLYIAQAHQRQLQGIHADVAQSLRVAHASAMTEQTRTPITPPAQLKLCFAGPADAYPEINLPNTLLMAPGSAGDLVIRTNRDRTDGVSYCYAAKWAPLCSPRGGDPQKDFMDNSLKYGRMAVVAVAYVSGNLVLKGPSELPSPERILDQAVAYVPARGKTGVGINFRADYPAPVHCDPADIDISNSPQALVWQTLNAPGQPLYEFATAVRSGAVRVDLTGDGAAVFLTHQDSLLRRAAALRRDILNRAYVQLSADLQNPNTGLHFRARSLSVLRLSVARTLEFAYQDQLLPFRATPGNRPSRDISTLVYGSGGMPGYGEVVASIETGVGLGSLRREALRDLDPKVPAAASKWWIDSGANSRAIAALWLGDADVVGVLDPKKTVSAFGTAASGRALRLLGAMPSAPVAPDGFENVMQRLTALERLAVAKEKRGLADPQ